MSQLFSRWLPCATLAAWSAIILVFTFDGRVKTALAGEFRTYALIAGVLLALGALVFLLQKKADASCCSDSACGHGLSRFGAGKLLTFLVLAVPMLLAFKADPEALKKVLAENRKELSGDSALVTASFEKRQQAAQLPPPLPAATDPAAPAIPGKIAEKNPTDWLVRTPEGNIVTEVLDLLYAAQDNVLRQDFEGKRVELVGQFMPDTASNPDGKRFKAVRMFMTCCAADARPVATLVEMEKPPGVPEMTWVKITGVPTFPIEKGRRISVLQAEKVEKTEPPADATLQ